MGCNDSNFTVAESAATRQSKTRSVKVRTLQPTGCHLGSRGVAGDGIPDVAARIGDGVMLEPYCDNESLIAEKKPKLRIRYPHANRKSGRRAKFAAARF